jgi:O-antigen ligase
MKILFTVTYFILISIVFARFFLLLLYQPRKAVLAGVIFTSLTLSALPWQLFPFRGIATALQLSFILGAFLVFLSGPDKGISRFVNIYSLLFFGLIFIMILFTLNSPGATYGISKILILILRALLPILALSALAPIQYDDIPIIFNTILIGSLMASLNLLSFSGLGSERAGFENLYAITAGRETGLGLALLLIYMLIKPPKIFQFFLLVIPLSILILGTIITGSRGPILAPLFAVLCTFLFAEYNFNRRLKILIRLGLSAILIFMLNQSLGEKTQSFQLVSLNRVINRLSTLGTNRSDKGRVKRYQVAWDGFISSNGLGYGTGSFDYFFKRQGKDINNDIREYPHNIFLEVAFEQGILGLVVLIASIVLVLYRIIRFTKRMPESYQIRALHSLYFFAFFNSLASSDIAGNYHFWIAGSFSWFIWVSCANNSSLAISHKENIKVLCHKA